MKTSIVIAATSAVLAAASPVEKRVFVTEVQTLYEVVTVTEGDVPLPTAPAGIKVRPQSPEPTVIVVTETFNPSEPTESPEPQPEVSVITIVETESPAPPEASESPTPEPSQSPEPEPEAPTLSLPSAIDVPQPTAPADNDFIGSAIYHHNVHRANHSSPALTWDTKIARYAANSAATCVFEHDMDQGDKGYGQNIAMWAVSSGAEELGAAGAIKMATSDFWYNGEFNNFMSDFYGLATPDMGAFESWGHFTQLIWKSTERLGCAVQYCPSGEMVPGMDAWYMVCNYGPQGNIDSEYALNVLKPLSEPSVLGV